MRNLALHFKNRKVPTASQCQLRYRSNSQQPVTWLYWTRIWRPSELMLSASCPGYGFTGKFGSPYGFGLNPRRGGAIIGGNCPIPVGVFGVPPVGLGIVIWGGIMGSGGRTGGGMTGGPGVLSSSLKPQLQLPFALPFSWLQSPHLASLESPS